MTNEDAIKYLKQLYPYGGHCWLDEQRTEAIGMAIKALQEEPVSEDLKEEITRYFSKNPIKHLTDWPALKNTALHFSNWQKEQMMAKAFPVEIDSSRSDGRFILSGNFARFETGDKVKLVIIKED